MVSNFYFLFFIITRFLIFIFSTVKSPLPPNTHQLFTSDVPKCTSLQEWSVFCNTISGALPLTIKWRLELVSILDFYINLNIRKLIIIF